MISGTPADPGPLLLAFDKKPCVDSALALELPSGESTGKNSELFDSTAAALINAIKVSEYR